jgi:hypothetical protein
MEYLRATSDDEMGKSPAIDHRVVSMPRLGGLHHRYDLAA